MQIQTVKIKAKQGLILPPSFWQKLGIKEGEEFVIQGTAPIITLIPKSLFTFYQQKVQSLTTEKLKKMGIEDQNIWQQEGKSLRDIRKKLNRIEYPCLYEQTG